MRKITVLLILFSFVLNCIVPPASFSQIYSSNINLPAPGTMVWPSQAYTPALLRGLVIHPEAPLQFDFIVDPGETDLVGNTLTTESQRMINYFLASLAVPEQDLWVNLSPAEEKRIIPNTLIKTELGRDLLAQDYILKQLTASLIYPEKNLGKEFWQRVYEEAYQRFGVTEIPVDVFNKVWIVPEKAQVFEKGHAVYIVKAHLKVMLEADYLAQSSLTNNENAPATTPGVATLSKQVLREIVVPAIEKEVNEGRNFAKLRQVFYAMVLAQWYQDVFKESVLNHLYTGKDKVSGIDLSDPKNKDFIYQQYMAAYRKGVFNYIKEETDSLTNEPIPRKYFSGGFQAQRIERARVDQAMVMEQATKKDMLVNVTLAKATDFAQSHEDWNNLRRPMEIRDELRSLWSTGTLDENGLLQFLSKYSAQVDLEAERGYPVQGAWPVTKAISLLSKEQEQQIVDRLQEIYKGKKRPLLADAILLMNNIVDEKWMENQAPLLIEKKIDEIASEIHLWVGGLGAVMNFDLKGLRAMGADAYGLEPYYFLRRDMGDPDGVPTNYNELIGSDLEVFDEFFVTVGAIDGKTQHVVKVRVWQGTDQDGIPGYFYGDVQKGLVSPLMFKNVPGLSVSPADVIGRLFEKGILEDTYFTGGKEGYFKKDIVDVTNDIQQMFGPENATIILKILAEAKDAESSFYMRMPYNYGGQNNPVSKRQSMAFLNVAVAEFLNRHPPDVVFANDGQFGPLEATTLSRHQDNPSLAKTFWQFRTHTYDAQGQGNRGESWNVDWEINVFFKHMLGLINGYLNYARRDGHIDDTSLGVRTADLATGVSNKHIDDMGPLDAQYATLTAVTNPAVPDIMAKDFRETFDRLKVNGVLEPEADYERPTPLQLALTKRTTKEQLLTSAKVIESSPR